MSAPAAGLRIGDAERAAAADRLAWHFSHGRLDQAELDERLAQAMQATTADDVTELFADLPADEPVAAAAGGGRRSAMAAGRPHQARAWRRPWLTVVVLALGVVTAISALHAAAHSIVILAVIGLFAAAWLRRGRTRDRGSPPSSP